MAEILEPVRLEHRPVGGRGPVETHARPNPLEHLGNRCIVATRGNETAAGDLEVLARAPGGGQAFLEARHHRLLHVAASAEPVQHDPVALLGGDFDGGGPDAGQLHPGRRRGQWRWGEVRRHQVELVVLACEVEGRPVLPAVPDRPKRADVLAQPWRGRAPRNAEPANVVAFHLAAEA